MTIETRPAGLVHPDVLPRLEAASAMLARAITGERPSHPSMTHAVIYIDQAIRLLSATTSANARQTPDKRPASKSAGER